MKAKYDIPLWQSFHFTNKLILIWQALKEQGKWIYRSVF
jgi:hypothetical protein